MAPKTKTAMMNREESRERAGTAREHLQVASERYQYAIASHGPSPSVQVSASNSILAGIAAADAITGVTLGARANDQDHAMAAALLATVLPDGTALAVKLRRTLTRQVAFAVRRLLHPGKVTRDAQACKCARRIDGSSSQTELMCWT